MTAPQSVQSNDGAVAATANVWLGLGAATGFLVWALQTPLPPESVDAAVRHYGWALLTGLGASAVVVLILRLTTASIDTLGLVSYASCLFYLAAGKLLGGDAVPWTGAAVAIVVVLLRRHRAVPAEPPLLLLHAMGTMSGLYLFFHVSEVWSAAPAFGDVLLALRAWLL